MATVGAFPYDLNNLLGGKTRVLYAPIAAAIPAGPSDIFGQVYPYNPQGGAYVTADAASGAVTLAINDTTTLPSSGSLFVASQSAAVTYTAKTTTSLTGIPASGAGSLTAAVSAGAFIHTANSWRDFGATREAFNYARNLAASGYQIQQVTGDVMEEVTDVQRTAAVSIAEMRPETLAIFEEGTQGTVETATYDSVAYGNVLDLTQYRIAFVARRNSQSGVVTETATTKTRGRYVVGLGFRAQLAADNVQIGMAKGELASATVTFRFFPETSGTQAEGQEFGRWFLERARTI